MSEIIRTENLVFKYPDAAGNALNGVSLSIEKGSFTAILGRNGSGKSTLARLINGLFVPTEGRVFVDGMDTALDEHILNIRRKVGMVFQNPDNQIVASVVEDDVAFGPENLGVPPAEIRERVDAALKAVGMYEYRLHGPHHLSGGQKQRVAIAGALAMLPECLVLDEPTAMLDPIGREEVLGTVLQLRKERGMTVILITHHMEECIPADRMIVMADGEVKMDGAPRDVFACAEEIKSLGLTVPAASKLISGLAEAGWELPSDAITPTEAAEAIAAYLR